MPATVLLPMQRGFTLLELVVILTIISVLAIFMSGRFADRSILEARGYYDELVAASRYAQRYAVASGCAVQLDINSNSYSLDLLDSRPGCAATPLQSPSGEVFAGNAPAGISVSGATGSHVFNSLGAVDAGGTLTVSDGATALSFTISAGSGFVVAN